MKTAPWGQDKIMKVDIIEHNSQNTKAVFTTSHFPVLILAEYLANGVLLEFVL